MRRLLMAMAVIALLMVMPSGSVLGKKPDTGVCKKGAWADLVRHDGTAFVDQASCVSYVANGGTPRAPVQNAFEAACLELDGAYEDGLPANMSCAWDPALSAEAWNAAYDALEGPCFTFEGGIFNSMNSNPQFVRWTCEPTIG